MRILAILLTLFLTILPSRAEIARGEIAGARYMIATPEQWQGKLVLIAHGFRPEGHPLDGNFDAEDAFSKDLLAKGWAIASTSFRRNGWIVDDAITDLKSLRDHIATQHGKINRCIVIGCSMGGLIGTRVAEGAIDGVDGTVLIGAFLGEPETEGFNKALTFKPKIPALFLTNESELDHPRHYRQQAGPEKTALWEVKRAGHCNVSDPERLNAVLAVNDWLDGKAIEKDRDATVPPPARESTAKRENGALQGKITVVSESWGNLTTSFVAADLQALGLKLGDGAIVSHGDKSLEVLMVPHWSDGPEGKGAIHLTPDGWVGVLIMNGRASAALDVKPGDPLTLSPKPAAAK